ncbi:MAG: hypothetical protein AABZ67_01925 [Pseudomonadota bacterium]
MKRSITRSAGRAEVGCFVVNPKTPRTGTALRRVSWRTLLAARAFAGPGMRLNGLTADYRHFALAVQTVGGGVERIRIHPRVCLGELHADESSC